MLLTFSQGVFGPKKVTENLNRLDSANMPFSTCYPNSDNARSVSYTNLKQKSIHSKWHANVLYQNSISMSTMVTSISYSIKPFHKITVVERCQVDAYNFLNYGGRVYYGPRIWPYCKYHFDTAEDIL